jgi:acetyl-CoA carboxylase biotin carboxyl carrier protein
MMGRFFRAPSPTEPPFVEPGGRVGPEDTVCLLEVMKLFSSVKAGVAGTVEAVLAENEAMVEEGQPLLAIRPD